MNKHNPVAKYAIMVTTLQNPFLNFGPAYFWNDKVTLCTSECGNWIDHLHAIHFTQREPVHGQVSPLLISVYNVSDNISATVHDSGPVNRSNNETQIGNQRLQRPMWHNEWCQYQFKLQRC